MLRTVTVRGSINSFPNHHLVNMDQKIFEYEKKIEFLEGKVIDLEKHNAGLREILIKNVQFSTKLSNIIYDMDCLLVKKGREIRDLQEKLENCLPGACISGADSPLMDFDMDICSEEHKFEAKPSALES